MATSLIARRHIGVCDIDGCGSTRPHYEMRDSEGTRRVCRRCAQELISMHGWSFARAADSSDKERLVLSVASNE